MRNIMSLYKRISFWNLLSGFAISIMLLIHPADTAAGAKDIESKICGENFELVWSKALYPLIKKPQEISIKVLPSGENYMVHTVIWKQEVPLNIITFLLDSNGNQLWHQEYIDELPFMADGGVFSVGKYTYRHSDSGNLRYHVWIDEKGIMQWVHAQRAISPLYKYHEEGYQREEVEVVDGVIYHLIANCKNGFCQVDSLNISEKGIDPKGWQTILKWPYPKDNKDKVIYSPVSVSISHLLVYKKEPKDVDAVEFHLIQFTPDGNRQIKYDSKYYFPCKSEKAFIKNTDGNFVFFVAEEKKGTFIRLDKTGKQIETRSYNLPQKFEFSINAIDPLKSGWLTIIGSIEERKGRDILRRLAMMRLSSNGQPLWFHVYDNDLDLAGMDSKNMFFSRQGTLYKCRERQIIIGK